MLCRLLYKRYVLFGFDQVRLGEAGTQQARCVILSPSAEDALCR